MPDPRPLPTGTVTFLFTDVAGSTAPQLAHPDVARDHALDVFDLFVLVLAAARAACLQRSDLIAENVLLRHQLAVLTRPTRRRRVRFGGLDKLLWVLVRRLRRDWRRHLVLVTPDTAARWHRAGWRLAHR